jgi:hypothetical protein
LHAEPVLPRPAGYVEGRSKLGFFHFIVAAASNLMGIRLIRGIDLLVNGSTDIFDSISGVLEKCKQSYVPQEVV